MAVADLVCLGMIESLWFYQHIWMPKSTYHTLTIRMPSHQCLRKMVQLSCQFTMQIWVSPRLIHDFKVIFGWQMSFIFLVFIFTGIYLFLLLVFWNLPFFYFFCPEIYLKITPCVLRSPFTGIYLSFTNCVLRTYPSFTTFVPKFTLLLLFMSWNLPFM